jgi:hypothetical protein
MSILKKILNQPKLSTKGKELINHYQIMANKGYHRIDGTFINDAYKTFELKKFKEQILPLFKLLNIDTLLDYGGGGSDWDQKNFYNDKSAKEYFGLSKVINYDPARTKDNIEISDCVVCFDVLEHIYLNDLNYVLERIYRSAKKLVILQIACYAASALLPTGENAHVTIRPPLWWKGYIDSITTRYPSIHTMLFCSTSYNKANVFKLWSNRNFDSQTNYSVNLE